MIVPIVTLLLGYHLLKCLGIYESWESGPAFYKNRNIELASNDWYNSASKASVVRSVESCNYLNIRQDCKVDAQPTIKACVCLSYSNTEFGARDEFTFYFL